MRAGSISPDATEIFHEGIIVPAVRIYREGVLNDEAFRIFLRNSRFPDILRGDIRAVLAGCQLGERRVLELFDRFGADGAGRLTLFEAQCRDTIRKTLESRIPDGTWQSEDAVDGDGMSGRSFHVRMRLTKEGGRISLDTRESDDQARGPINFIMHESVPS
jgi:N-methylhydantoinase B